MQRISTSWVLQVSLTSLAYVSRVAPVYSMIGTINAGTNQDTTKYLHIYSHTMIDKGILSDFHTMRKQFAASTTSASLRSTALHTLTRRKELFFPTAALAALTASTVAA